MVSHVNAVVFCTILIYFIVEGQLHYIQTYLHKHRFNLDERRVFADRPKTHTPTYITAFSFEGWTEWAPWSECTMTCRGGSLIRTRDCVDTDSGEVLGPESCFGVNSDLTEKAPCKTDIPCAGEQLFVSVLLLWCLLASFFHALGKGVCHMFLPFPIPCIRNLTLEDIQKHCTQHRTD